MGGRDEIEDSCESSFGRKRLCILTKHHVSILESFKIIVKGKVFMVRAKELFTWNPSFESHKEKVYSSDDESVQGEELNENRFNLNKEEEGELNGNEDDEVAELIIMEILLPSMNQQLSRLIGTSNTLKDPLDFYDFLETKMEKVPHMDVKFMWGNSNYDYVFSESVGNSDVTIEGELNGNEDDEVAETIFMDNSSPSLNHSVRMDKQYSADPFRLYDLLDKKTPEVETLDPSPSLSHPPGFSQVGSAKSRDKEHVMEENTIQQNKEFSPSISAKVMNNSQVVQDDVSYNSGGGSEKKKGGSVLGVLEEMIRVGRVVGYSMEGCLGNKTKKEWVKELTNNNKLNFIAIQETKMEKVPHMDVKFMWGNSNYDYVFSESIGNSGGILCIWEESIFRKNYVTISDSFVAIYGTWIPNKTKILIVSIYAPQQPSLRRVLWDYLSILLGCWNGEAILMVDIKMEGYTFTWSHPSAEKMSKLDRFLVSDGILTLFPSITALCMDRHLSDHRPILLCEVKVDFGPIPFRFYHSWFKLDGFDDMVERTWSAFAYSDNNSMIRFKKKLQELKKVIRLWINVKKSQLAGSKNSIVLELRDIDKQLDQIGPNDLLIFRRHELKCNLNDLKEMESMDSFQKSKVRWAIEGDENSKYFHGIINKKRSHLAIRGVFDDGIWRTDPSSVKKALRDHYEARFNKPTTTRLKLSFPFPKRLSTVQVDDLERGVSHDEIRSAVWDCGDNKSPGPDGFIFEFFNKYWRFIGPDFCEAVEHFFKYGLFSKGCNSSFIAFVADRQILEGPFILNEVLDWCKRKNKGTFCYAKTSILVNGSPSDEFHLHCGLKQGDPLSPYLFILVMESLHLFVSRAVDKDCSIMEKKFRYLGVMVDERMSRYKAWDDVVLKLKTRLSKWKAKTFSIGGRLTLLKSVLGASPLYNMSIFKVWRFVSQDGSLWFRVIQAVHGNKIDTHTVHKSSIWSAILKEVHVLKSTGFDFMSYCSKRIDVRGGVEQQEFSELCSILDSVMLSQASDRWYCSLSSSGDFCVKEVRTAIDDMALPSHPEPTRWVKFIPIKINIFVWRSRRDCLPTRHNLVHKGVVLESTSCPVCLSGLEDVHHILFRCSLAQEVLHRVCRWWEMDFQHWSSFGEEGVISCLSALSLRCVFVKQIPPMLTLQIRHTYVSLTLASLPVMLKKTSTHILVISQREVRPLIMQTTDRSTPICIGETTNRRTINLLTMADKHPSVPQSFNFKMEKKVSQKKVEIKYSHNPPVQTTAKRPSIVATSSSMEILESYVSVTEGMCHLFANVHALHSFSKCVYSKTTNNSESCSACRNRRYIEFKNGKRVQVSQSSNLQLLKSRLRWRLILDDEKTRLEPIKEEEKAPEEGGIGDMAAATFVCKCSTSKGVWLLLLQHSLETYSSDRGGTSIVPTWSPEVKTYSFANNYDVSHPAPYPTTKIDDRLPSRSNAQIGKVDFVRGRFLRGRMSSNWIELLKNPLLLAGS
ncbi:RNA-directed DNA polymerase, eukaryota [Tanacetum coccineum]|uniref:RNA-directed DNA polymerase, eukaryota n=1 Tax=Tanacetum coccineum TaxID=301880 RepID=A0ABQ4YL96_9ASTR